jgi:hypothetical protein
MRVLTELKTDEEVFEFFLDKLDDWCRKQFETNGNVGDWSFVFQMKFPTLWKSVLKQALKESGVDTQSKNQIRANRFLSKALETKVINLQELKEVSELKEHIDKYKVKP